MGQQVSDRTLEEIVQEIQQIEPSIFPQIDRIHIKQGQRVISLVVSAGPNRPYSYRGQAWKRVGNTSLKMSRDPLELLRGFGLLRNNQLFRAAVVLFGRQERLEAEYPQCLLRVAKFKGTDKTEFIDNRQFSGNVFRLLNLAEQFLRESLPIAGRVVPHLFERADDPLYPPIALREALANAFCHRDYSIGGGSVGVAIYDDRLEISSSGTLHFGLTPQKLLEPHESLPWNPMMARVFHRRGIIRIVGARNH